MTRPGGAVAIVTAAAAVVVAAVGASAQVDPLPPLTPTTTAPPRQQPTTTTTTSPLQGLTRSPASTPPTTASPGPAGRASGAPPGVPAVPGGGDGVVPPAGVGPFPPELAALSRSVRRSGSRNTKALVDGLRELTELGLPHDEAVRVGMGRFPVGGYATYSHDWWFPRFGPGWRLHMGTDLFAVRGTPVRAPGDGVVRFSNGGLGGISTYLVQADGTYFYMAHLDGRPKDLRDGQAVRVGDVVGYVGSSGNAAGGSPHLHFEIHPAVKVVTVGKGKRRTTKVVPRPVRPGTVLPAADPKAYLDAWLEEAVANLPAVVASYRANLPPPAPPGAPGAPPLPPDAVLEPGLTLASGPGLLPGSRPIVRVPLVALAFMLVLMVGALTPVLAPRRAPASARAAGRAASSGGAPPPAELPEPEPKPKRRRRQREKAHRDRPAGAPVSGAAEGAAPASPPERAGGPAGDGSAGDDEGRRRRLRRRRRRELVASRD